MMQFRPFLHHIEERMDAVVRIFRDGVAGINQILVVGRGFSEIPGLLRNNRIPFCKSFVVFTDMGFLGLGFRAFFRRNVKS